MMLLSETAREQGLFDWVAATAAIHAGGSTARLFLLVYVTGIVTTTFLSNDATAVVLTPAVYAAARKAKAEPLAAAVRLRADRQRGELRAADLQPRQSRALWRHDAAARAMVRLVRAAVAGRDRGDLCRAALGRAHALGGRCECDVAREPLSQRRQGGVRRHRGDRGAADRDVGVRSAAWAADLPCRIWRRRWGFARSRSDRRSHWRVGVVERAAAGRRAVRAGRGARSHRRDPRRSPARCTSAAADPTAAQPPPARSWPSRRT